MGYSSCLLIYRGERENDRKGSATPLLTVQRDFPSHPGGQLLDNRQPQPNSWMLPRDRAIDPSERLKDIGLGFSRDARPGVGHNQRPVAQVVPSNADANPAILGRWKVYWANHQRRDNLILAPCCEPTHP